MIKKLLLSIAPVLVLASFAVMPAFAQAETKEYGTCELGGIEESPPCPKGEKKFTAFTTKVAVLSKKRAGSGNFNLETAGGGIIECTTLTDMGTDENVGTPPNAVGHSTDTLFFDGCKVAVGALKGCEVNSFFADKGDVVVTITNLVLKETEVEIKLPAGGVELEVPGTQKGIVACETKTALGSVTGTAKGTQAKGTNILAFAKAKGLKLGIEEATITGETETITEGTKKQVVIN